MSLETTIRNVLPKKDIIFSLQYGSRKNDTDVFVVLNEKPDEKNLVIDDLDIFESSLTNLKHTIRLLDINYTEPMLTGEFLFGDREAFETLQKELYAQRADAYSLKYLALRSIECGIQAEHALVQEKYNLFAERSSLVYSPARVFADVHRIGDFAYQSTSHKESISSIGYALSYLSACKRNAQSEKRITLKEILAHPQDSTEALLKEVKNYEKENTPKANMARTQRYLQMAQGELEGCLRSDLSSIMDYTSPMRWLGQVLQCSDMGIREIGSPSQERLDGRFPSPILENGPGTMYGVDGPLGTRTSGSPSRDDICKPDPFGAIGYSNNNIGGK